MALFYQKQHQKCKGVFVQIAHGIFAKSCSGSDQISFKAVQVFGFYDAFQIQAVLPVLLHLHAAALPHGGGKTQLTLVIAVNIIAYRLTRDTDPDDLTRWALMVLAVWVAQAIILNVIVKPLWSRPRMRVIEVTPGLNFQPWWVIGNPDKWSYIAAGVIKDGFKSPA